MKYLAIILIGLLSVSCMTVKRIEKNCDLFAKVCITETETETEITTETKTEIEYRDTTIYIEIPGKEVIKEIPVYIEKGIVNSGLSVLNVPFAKGLSQVINSKLRHELIQTDTLLLFKLENALKTIKTLEKQNTVLKEKYVVTVKENSRFAIFAIKWLWISFSIISILLLTTIFKNKLLKIFK